MEMIYVPQAPADWQAGQEGVAEPHCAVAPLEQWEGKWADHRDAPSAGIREISLTQKLSYAYPGMEESWPVIFSEIQAGMHCPKGYIFPWVVPRGRWCGGLYMFIIQEGIWIALWHGVYVH